MKETAYNFQYNPKNLDLFKIDLFGGKFDIDILFLAVIMIIVGMMIYLVSPYVKGYFLVSAEEKRKEDNKNKIKELILMKEVQTELEKDIEESLLNAGLKIKTA